MRWFLVAGLIFAILAVIGQQMARERCLKDHGYWSEGTNGFNCITLPEAMRP